MDIDLLSKMVKELILDMDEVTLPGVGAFVAETVPASFSDRGYTINPPYRKLSFRQRQGSDDAALVSLYAKTNSIELEKAETIVTEFLKEMKEILMQKKNIVFPGLGRLRSTKENNFFFVADEDLDIYPDGFGLEPISLKTHKEESPEEVSAAILHLKEEISLMPQAEPSESVTQEEPVAKEETQSQEEPQSQEQSQPVEVQVKMEQSQEELHQVPEEELQENVSQNEEKEAVEKVEKKKMPLWVKIVLWCAATVVIALALFALGARLFPEFFDSLLYSAEELEIINY